MTPEEQAAAAARAIRDRLAGLTEAAPSPGHADTRAAALAASEEAAARRRPPGMAAPARAMLLPGRK